MIAMKRCNECSGEYAETTGDGGRYFHVCPPNVVIRVRRADASIATIDRAAVLPTDTIIEETTAPRRNGRNENPRGTGARPGDRIAEGTGATDVSR